MDIVSPKHSNNNSISVKGIIWICTLNWFLFSRLHCSASYSNIYSVRPNTISILFLFINGILNVARFQNCATLVDISKVQKRAVSRISLFLERTIMFAIVLHCVLTWPPFSLIQSKGKGRVESFSLYKYINNNC